MCNIIVGRKMTIQHTQIPDMGRSWKKVSVNSVSDGRSGYVAVDQWWVEKCVEVHRLGARDCVQG